MVCCFILKKTFFYKKNVYRYSSIEEGIAGYDSSTDMLSGILIHICLRSSYQ